MQNDSAQDSTTQGGACSVHGLAAATTC
jgi:hypothetical protein